MSSDKCNYCAQSGKQYPIVQKPTIAQALELLTNVMFEERETLGCESAEKLGFVVEYFNREIWEQKNLNNEVLK